MNPSRKSNRLINEKSPYLLQHAYNPVDWYPWSEEAFARARHEQKPIFLSVGYSTCYWCHVMEREVFENDEIAKLMNERLVNVKVDREERPDVDRVYMTAVQAMTGSGGWPMSVFLTPDLKPFYAATYIPPKAQYGRPGFPDVVGRISELWNNERQKLLDSGEQILSFLRMHENESQVGGIVDESILDRAFEQFRSNHDKEYGGFGHGTKFPRPSTFNFLLRYYHRTGRQEALDMTLSSLMAMAKSGMHDHIGGGFHRYAVDRQWRVPHFEKMLYDQAQLVISFLEAFQITHEDRYAAIARKTLDYVISTLRHHDGGFFSAEDAESAPDPSKPQEKEEGAFYVWTKSEIDAILLPKEAQFFCFHYGIQEAGNAAHDPMGIFLGKNILSVAHSEKETASEFATSKKYVALVLENARHRLFLAREKRPRPHLDDKIITAWNGLMISAFARAHQILRDERYFEAAREAATFVSTRLREKQTGKLLRRYRDSDARFDAGLQDYTFFVQGLLDLYEASFDIQWLTLAIDLTSQQIERFLDPDSGGFFDTSGNDPSILIRSKEEYDGAEPSGNSIAALNLQRLSLMTNNKDWAEIAEKVLQYFTARITQIPESAPQLLVSVSWMLSIPSEIIIASGLDNRRNDDALLRAVHHVFLPTKILLGKKNSDSDAVLSRYLPFIANMSSVDGKTTAYICRNFSCQMPTSNPEEVIRLIEMQSDNVASK